MLGVLRLEVCSPRLILMTASLALLFSAPGFSAQDSEAYFESRVRPVLEEHCFRCHGEDRQRSGLRLDSGAALFAGGARGPAVVAGDADGSLLIEAVRYADEEFAMPPKGRLDEAEIAALVEWVEMGAVYPEGAQADVSGESGGFDLAERATHWAFQPLVEGAGGIDEYVGRGLEAAGLTAVPAAERGDLLRRLSFDLVGLPPGVAWLEANADRPIDEVVDELLDSEQYGVRWARHWLDLMRYAEGRGHEFDGNIPNAYQYRDYVVRALNADVPYDEFVVEHLAGDLVEPPRMDPDTGANESVLGTGWWFLGAEMHSPVDIRKDELERTSNKVDVLSRGFLGLTVACARCHDHKFDAIGAADYYALSGFGHGGSVRQVRFETMLANGRVAEGLAALDASGAGALQVAAAATVRREALELARGLEAQASGEGELGEGATARLEAAWEDVQDPLHAFAFIERTTRRRDEVQVELQFGKVMEERRQLFAWEPGIGEPRMLAEFAGAADVALQDGFGFAVRKVGEALFSGIGGLGVAAETAAFWDPTWDLLEPSPESERAPKEHAYSWDASGRMLRTATVTLETGRVFHRVQGAGHVFAVVDAHRIVQGPLHSGLTQTLAVEGEGFGWIEQDLSAYVGHRVHFEYSPQRLDGRASRFAVAKVVEGPMGEAEWRPVHAAAWGSPAWVESLSRVEPTVAGLAGRYVEVFREVADAWEGDERPAGNAARWGAWLLESAVVPGEISAELAAAREELVGEIQALSRTALAMLDGSGVNEFILSRGNPATPLGVVERRYLEVFDGADPLAIDTGSGRLELARRMTDPNHPLLARVWVNRIWHQLIGRGLVASVDDFGRMGELPSHPELLDNLARLLIDSGWSTKAVIREVLLSEAYGRSTRPGAGAAELDPTNALLSHAHRKRLQGEAIRDAMLSVSGTLDLGLGGPPVPLYLTDELQGRGRPEVSGPLDGDGRRSLYLAVRRNFLTPFLAVFDFPPPATTMGRRDVSSLPAQALTMLNDPFVIGEAQRWAERMLEAEGDDGARVEQMFRQALGRGPDEAERSATLEYVAERSAVDGPSLAWTELAHSLFNLNEFIYLD